MQQLQAFCVKLSWIIVIDSKFYKGITNHMYYESLEGLVYNYFPFKQSPKPYMLSLATTLSKIVSFIKI